MVIDRYISIFRRCTSQPSKYTDNSLPKSFVRRALRLRPCGRKGESCRTTFEGWVKHRQKWSQATRVNEPARNTDAWHREAMSRKYTNLLFINIYLGPIIGSIFYPLEIYRELGSLAACAASWALRRRSVQGFLLRRTLRPSARRGKRPWEPALGPLTASNLAASTGTCAFALAPLPG